MKHVEPSRWNEGPSAARSVPATLIDDLGYLEPSPAQAALGLGGRLLGLPAVWRERSRLRRDLARICARDLKDAGLSIEAVQHEVSRPFWRPLDRERK